MRAAILVGAVALAGCGSGQEKSHQDIHRYSVDRTPAAVILMPNDFGNVAHKCDGHGHRVFVTTNPGDHPSSLVVMSDPSCGK